MSGNGDVKVNDDQPVQLAEAPEGEGVTSTTPARGLWDLLDEYRQLHATWRQTHTEEDRRRMRVAWSIPLTCPGSGMGETERIRPGQWDRCTPTVLSSDHWPEPEHLQYRGACLGCGWVAERTHRRAGGENGVAGKERGTNRQVEVPEPRGASGRSRAFAIEVRRVAVAEGEASGHVEPDFAVGSDVRPEQWGESTEIFGGEDAGRFGFGEDVLDHERVDVHQSGLEDVQGEHSSCCWSRRLVANSPLLP